MGRLDCIYNAYIRQESGEQGVSVRADEMSNIKTRIEAKTKAFEVKKYGD